MDTRRLQHFLGHASITNTVRYTAMSPEPFKDIWRRDRSRRNKLKKRIAKLPELLVRPQRGSPQ
jgi:hypothetical protein